MAYFTAILFGISIGTLYAYDSFPTIQWVPAVALTVLLAIGVGYSSSGPNSAPVLGVLIGLVSILALALAGATRWNTNPLFAESGYWSRVGIWMWHVKQLRHANDNAMRSASS